MNDTTLNNVSSEAGSQRGPRSLPQNGDCFIVTPHDPILVTGAAGFIGSRVVENLLNRGFRNLICFARASGKLQRIEDIAKCHPQAQIKLIEGNLLSREDCEAACKDVTLIIHLAAGTGEKSLPELRRTGVRSDFFAFLQGLPESLRNIRIPWDNMAVLSVSTFEHWWTEEIGLKARKKANQAERRQLWSMKLHSKMNSMIALGAYDYPVLER